MLIANGFDDMDTLLCIEDDDLLELGIGPCHMVKLRRKLHEIQHREAAEKQRMAKEVENPVAVFLRDIGLGQYASAFLDGGFDEMLTLFDMEESDMKDLGLPRGHALKLRRRLREMRSTQDGAVPEPQVEPMPPTPSSEQALPPPPEMKPRLRSPPSGSTLPDEAGMTAVERSWECLQARGVEEMAKKFYRNLFLTSPEAMALFPMEVRRKYRDWMTDERAYEDNVYESPALRKLFAKMINAIGCTVAGLHDFGKLVPMLTQLGARHANYGIGDAHWPMMRKALINTLREYLEGGFTHEVETAWTMVYTFMTSIMIEGLRCAIATREANALAAATLIEAPRPWVEDCRSQGFRAELSHTVTPGTATTVIAQEVLCCGARLKKLPRLWEDDEDGFSEDSLSTDVPSQYDIVSGRDSLRRADAPPTNCDEVLRQTPKSLCRGRTLEDSQPRPLVAG